MLNFLILICVIYGCLFFLDLIFTTCMFYPYITSLNSWGLSIKPFRIIWTTTYFNRTIIRTGRFKFLQKWFDIGAYMWVFSLPAMFFLFYTFFSTSAKDSISQASSSPLVSVIPGINTPLSDVVYIIPALFVSIIVHEFGHALAASREKISVENVGIAVYAVIPVAFVNLFQEQLAQLHPKRQLPVYCAGVWHNLILFILCMFLMFASPFLCLPIFQQGKGVTVVHIEQSSGAAQLGGFLKDDIIISANDCQIGDQYSWRTCLGKILSEPQRGFCSSKEFIKEESYNTNGGNTPNCCTNSSGHFCFENDGVKEYSCLPARKLIEHSEFCRNTKDCNSGVCLVPALSSQSERFVKFHRKNKTSILYIGSIQEIFSSIQVTQWVSRFEYISAKLMHHYDQFLAYLIGFNAGLIIMNLAPCYGLDGGFIIATLIHLYFSWLFKKPSTRNVIIEVLKLVGFILILKNCYLAVSNSGFLDDIKLV